MFLKKAKFLSETGKLLFSSSLCNLGAIFVIVVNKNRNLSKANIIANQIFQYNLKNNTVLSQRYTIVNYRPCEVSSN